LWLWLLDGFFDDIISVIEFNEVSEFVVELFHIRGDEETNCWDGLTAVDGVTVHGDVLLRQVLPETAKTLVATAHILVDDSEAVFLSEGVFVGEGGFVKGEVLRS
jgi:hypothetical protein